MENRSVSEGTGQSSSLTRRVSIAFTRRQYGDPRPSDLTPP
jgi:hypothetical protein